MGTITKSSTKGCSGMRLPSKSCETKKLDPYLLNTNHVIFSLTKI